MDHRRRIAIIDRDRCKPDRCNKECIRVCVVNSSGKQCVTLKTIANPLTSAISTDMAVGTLTDAGVKKVRQIADIEEALCIGCGACIKVCPFNAIKIVNLKQEIPEEHRIFQYGYNTFRLYRMVVPKRSKILGLLGSNGVGKSTILRLLSDTIRPNFGKLLPKICLLANWADFVTRNFCKKSLTVIWAHLPNDKFLQSDWLGWHPGNLLIQTTNKANILSCKSTNGDFYISTLLPSIVM